MLDYVLQNLKRGDDGEDEIDDWLVLVCGTVKYLEGSSKVDEATIQRIWNRIHCHNGCMG